MKAKEAEIHQALTDKAWDGGDEAKEARRPADDRSLLFHGRLVWVIWLIGGFG